MKKTVSVLLVLALTILMLAGCNKKETPPENVAPPATSAPSTTEAPRTQPEPEPAKETALPSISIKDYEYTIAGADLVTDKDGQVLRVFFDVTNTSDTIQPVSEAFVFDNFVYQNDTELKASYGKIGDAEEYDNMRKSIFPGVTIRRVTNFHLLDESDVHYFLGEYKSETGLELDFDITDLPEISPAPEIVPIPTVEPASGMEGYQGEKAEFSYSGNKYELELVKHEVVEQKGEKYLRVYYKYTVLELKDPEKPVNPAMTGSYYFYQDGITIGTFLPSDVPGIPMTEDMTKSTENIGVGESSYFAVGRALTSDSDVLVMAGTGKIKTGEPFIGTVVSVK